MTPDVQAAAERLRDFARGWAASAGAPPADLPLLSVQLRPTVWAHFTLGDLATVLTALDPAEQPIGHIPTKAGLNYLEIRRQQNPRNKQ